MIFKHIPVSGKPFLSEIKGCFTLDVHDVFVSKIKQMLHPFIHPHIVVHFNFYRIVLIIRAFIQYGKRDGYFQTFLHSDISLQRGDDDDSIYLFLHELCDMADFLIDGIVSIAQKQTIPFFVRHIFSAP